MSPHGDIIKVARQQIHVGHSSGEARATEEDKIALVLAALRLEQNQVCTCGAEAAEAELRRREGSSS